ncbi:MAG: hypothetical protein RI909_195 [Bacteroidota bacterium]|jgi:hypothetical protein
MSLLKRNPAFTSFCVVLLSLLSLQLLAQTGVITGKVRDAATAEALPFTHVFINQTTIGTVSDAQGVYTLSQVPVGTHEIIFSFVGYKPYQTRIQIKGGESRQLDIRLQSDDMQLETVEVKGTRDKEWDKQLKKFEKVFLGSTRFAASTKILNAWILEFKEIEVNGKDVFTATASKPIEIENQALGYKIYYYLKSMASNAEGHNITGELRFEELASSDPKIVKGWNQNRLDAYHGSLRHLVKSMIDGTAEKEGFNLYIDKSGYENSMQRTSVFSAQLDKSIKSFATKDIVLPGKTDDEFSIALKQRLEIHYTQERAALKVYSDITYPVSWLQVNGSVLRANAKGILLNPSQVIVSGAMYEARVADLLPNNYLPDQTNQVITLESPTAKKLKRMEEKAYVQTDKPYYYPGEKIWFKAYMNYRTPELMDSLSRVLVVELISPDKKMEQTKLLFIDGGAVDGYFDLPDKIETGNYILRAYTQWMMNYDHTNFFIKTLPVLGVYERPVAHAGSDSVHASPYLKLTTDKSSYQPREKIDLEFTLRDREGNPMAADLSVSVTDMKRVVQVPEATIENLFLFPQQEKVMANEIRYPVESSIILTGQYKNKKGLPSKASFMMANKESNKMVPIQADANGNFMVSNLLFYDTADMAFQMMGKQKKFDGTISITNREVPSTEHITAVRSFSVEKMELEQREKLSNRSFKETTVLDNVDVQDQRIEPSKLNKDNVPNSYAKADFSLSGEEIVQLSRTSLLNALKGRIPGLILVNGFIRLGSPSNFMGPSTTEPLLIVDGVQITGGGSESIVGRINQIVPDMVERVDVIKYGGGAIYGTRGANGVIIITTKSGHDVVSPASVDGLALLIPVIGFSKPENFTAPDYSQTNRDGIQPDYRSTIYWAPQVVTDRIGKASVSFYAADQSSRYQIVVEGVSAMGEPIRGVFFIDVK